MHLFTLTMRKRALYVMMLGTFVSFLMYQGGGVWVKNFRQAQAEPNTYKVWMHAWQTATRSGRQINSMCRWHSGAAEQQDTVLKTSARQIKMQSVTLAKQWCKIQYMHREWLGTSHATPTRQAKTEQKTVIDDSQRSEGASPSNLKGILSQAPGAPIRWKNWEDVAGLHGLSFLSSSSAELSVKKSGQVNQTIAGLKGRVVCPWVPINMSMSAQSKTSKAWVCMWGKEGENRKKWRRERRHTRRGEKWCVRAGDGEEGGETMGERAAWGGECEGRRGEGRMLHECASWRGRVSSELRGVQEEGEEERGGEREEPRRDGAQAAGGRMRRCLRSDTQRGR